MRGFYLRGLTFVALALYGPSWGNAFGWHPKQMQNPDGSRGIARKKQLRWLNHARIGIPVNIRYQSAKNNFSAPLICLQNLALIFFNLQY